MFISFWRFFSAAAPFNNMEFFMDYPRPIRTDIDWSALSFGYMPTRSHIAFHWKDGEWDKGELKTDPHITMSVAATCLHYGQACFEGMKAFRCKDGKVRVFRPWEKIGRASCRERVWTAV